MANVFDAFDTPSQQPKQPNVFDAFDQLPSGNEPSIAAHGPGGGFPAPSPATDWYDQYVTPYLPSFLQRDAHGQPVSSGFDEGTKFAGRNVALRANPYLAIPNAAFVGTQEALNAASGKLGGPTKDVFNPLEWGISKSGLGLSPDASPAMQTADAIAPFAVPSGNQLARVDEAAGLYNKAMTFARSEGMNLASWAASEEAQKYAREHGFGPLAQMVAGFAGGAAPGAISHVVGPPVARTVIPPKEDAGATFDYNKNLLPPEGSSTVSTVPPLRDVADQSGSIASIVSGAGSLPLSGSGQTGAVKAQTAAIARTADAGLQALDPGTTSVLKAGPASVGKESSTLANQSRDVIANEEMRLKDTSNAIESQLINTRVDAGPLRRLVEGLTDPQKVGDTVAAHGATLLRKLDAAIGPDGTIPFSVLKTERSKLKEDMSGLTSPSTGEPMVGPSVAEKLQPVENAMTERMGAAADSVSPQLGDQWRANDEAWSSHSQTKRDLADTGGVLTRVRPTGPDKPSYRFEPEPGAADVSTVTAKAVGGKGGIDPIRSIEEGLGEQPARSAVAETVAAMGRPRNARGTQDFRPDLFGEGEQARIDPDVLKWIEEKAGPEARRNIENAAGAGAATAAPPRPGGWSKAFGNVLSAAPFVGPAAAAFGHVTGAFSPIVTAILSAAHDPDLIRSIANRNRSWGDIAPQLATRSALGSQPSSIDPVKTISSGLSSAYSTIPGMLKYLTVPQGGQR